MYSANFSVKATATFRHQTLIISHRTIFVTALKITFIFPPLLFRWKKLPTNIQNGKYLFIGAIFLIVYMLALLLQAENILQNF